MDKKICFLKIMQSAAEKRIKADSYRWPICTGILHQPKRPTKETESLRKF